MLQQFLSWKFPENIEYIVGLLLIWSGFAILSGMIARIFIWSRRFQNTWTTYVMGFVGACLGSIFARNILKIEDFTPISPVGLCFSVLATLCCMAMFCIVSFMLRSDEEISDEEEEEDEEQFSYERRDDFRRIENISRLDDEDEPISRPQRFRGRDFRDGRRSRRR